MRVRGHVRLARGLPLLLAAALGATTVALPSIAQSESAPTIEAQNSGYYYHSWYPAQVSINAGGTVSFSNPSEVAHGVEWRSPPTTPGCSAGVPVGTSPEKSGTKWSGTCTFSQPGVYTFWCTVHRSAMSGTITVNPNGETTASSTTYPTTSTATPGTSGGGSQGAPAPVYGASGPSSPLAGSAAHAVQLPAIQRGYSVRGAVEISQAGAGGRLEVDLLTQAAALASAGHPARVRVGRLVLAHLQAGMVAFSVPLNSRARAALRRHRRLAIVARMQIEPLGGPVLTIARSLLVRR